MILGPAQSRSGSWPGRAGAAALAAAWLAGSTAAPAQSELPDGVRIGRWILAPSAFLDLESDANLLRTDDSRESIRDHSAEYGGALAASLPFRNSLFRIGYEASKLGYSAVDFERDLSEETTVDLDLQFGSGNRLVLRDSFTRGSVRLRDLVGEDTTQAPEEVFYGAPWNQNRAQLRLERAVPGRQGWRVQLERRDFNYRGQELTSLYDSRGFESDYEFRQPVTSRGWVVFYYGTRRFNHYRPQDEVGVPYRKELEDSFQLGWRGLAGAGNPYLIRLGYERVNFEIQTSSFEGLSALLTGSFRAGPYSRTTLELSRRAFASTEDTHYINNRFSGEFETQVLGAFDLRTRAVLAFNQYVDPVDSDCGGELREDWIRGLEAGLAWPLEPWIELGLSGTHERRNSSCPFGDYDDTEVRAGLRVGWF